MGSSKNRSRSHVRYSVGGFTPGGIHGTPVVPVLTGSATATGPRRVRLVEPWKVEDIMVPLADEEETPEEEQEEDEMMEMSMQSRSVTMSPSKKVQVSEEERKVISVVYCAYFWSTNTDRSSGYHRQKTLRSDCARFVLWG